VVGEGARVSVRKPLAVHFLQERSGFHDLVAYLMTSEFCPFEGSETQ
jgi:hypothetical protein